MERRIAAATAGDHDQATGLGECAAGGDDVGARYAKNEVVHTIAVEVEQIDRIEGAEGLRAFGEIDVACPSESCRGGQEGLDITVDPEFSGRRIGVIAPAVILDRSKIESTVSVEIACVN